MDKYIETEYHNIFADMLEMFPDIKQLQYIIKYDVMRRIWDYGSDRYGTYKENSLHLFEQKVKRTIEVAKHYDVPIDIENVKNKLNRLFDLGKIYRNTQSKNNKEQGMSDVLNRTGEKATNWNLEPFTPAEYEEWGKTLDFSTVDPRRPFAPVQFTPENKHLYYNKNNETINQHLKDFLLIKNNYMKTAKNLDKCGLSQVTVRTILHFVRDNHKHCAELYQITPEYTKALDQYRARHNPDYEDPRERYLNAMARHEDEREQAQLLREGHKNNKEHSMSDVNEGTKQFTEADEAAFRNALHQREIISGALKVGTLSCLPGPDGFADTMPAVNITNGNYYHGANMLYLKEHQKQHGFPTAEYIPSTQIEKAALDNPGIAIKDGEKGVTIHFSEQNNETQEWVKKSSVLINVNQTTDPQGLKNWIAEQQQKVVDKITAQFSESYKPSEPKQRVPGPEISCTSTDPEKYLGQYLAAVSMGGKFKVSPEQAKEFTQKMDASLTEKMENGYPNPFKLSKISNEASKNCKEFMKELGAETRKNEREQQQEQQQSRGMKR